MIISSLGLNQISCLLINGVDNSVEMLAGTNPYDADTDNDGILYG